MSLPALNPCAATAASRFALFSTASLSSYGTRTDTIRLHGCGDGVVVERRRSRASPRDPATLGGLGLEEQYLRVCQQVHRRVGRLAPKCADPRNVEQVGALAVVEPIRQTLVFPVRDDGVLVELREYRQPRITPTGQRVHERLAQAVIVASPRVVVNRV